MSKLIREVQCLKRFRCRHIFVWYSDFGYFSQTHYFVIFGNRNAFWILNHIPPYLFVIRVFVGSPNTTGDRFMDLVPISHFRADSDDMGVTSEDDRTSESYSHQQYYRCKMFEKGRALKVSEVLPSSGIVLFPCMYPKSIATRFTSPRGSYVWM